MNMNSLRLLAVACALIAGSNVPFVVADTPQKPTKVAPKMSLYIEEKGKPGQLDRELIVCDFGERDFLDMQIREEEIDNRGSLSIPADEYVTGVKKHFYLVNDGNVNLKILSNVPDPFATGIYRMVGKRFVPIDSYKETPYVLKPNEKIELVIAFDYTSVVPGKVEEIIQLCDPQDNCYATFAIRANVKSGIEISPQRLDFGALQSGTKSSLDFNLKLDRRLPHFTMAPFEFVSANKNLRITSVPPTLKLKGVGISKAGIEFKRGRSLDKDLDLKFRVELLDTAPIGKINQDIKLSIPSSPNFLLLGNAKLRVNAEVTGHMQATPSGSINFGNLPPKKAAKKVATISCSAPLTPGSLRVVSSNRYVTVRLLPPTQADSQVAKLEMILSPNAPAGKLIGKVTVTNTINKERLEILTGGTVKR